jgi:hypothetical protein
MMQFQRMSLFEQFKGAINVNNDNAQYASFSECLFHLATLPWKVNIQHEKKITLKLKLDSFFFAKVAFSLIPPVTILNGLASLIVSLFFLSLISYAIVRVSLIFGCLVNVKKDIILTM